MAEQKTKKEELVDLTPKPEKITDEQLEKLQGNIRTIDGITAQVGSMELQKFHLMRNVKEFHDNLDALREEFKREYGTDNINIQNGTIAYPPENSNQEENGEADKKD